MPDHRHFRDAFDFFYFGHGNVHGFLRQPPSMVGRVFQLKLRRLGTLNINVSNARLNDVHENVPKTDAWKSTIPEHPPIGMLKNIPVSWLDAGFIWTVHSRNDRRSVGSPSGIARIF
jgi:hypothetical protein